MVCLTRRSFFGTVVAAIAGVVFGKVERLPEIAWQEETIYPCDVSGAGYMDDGLDCLADAMPYYCPDGDIIAEIDFSKFKSKWPSDEVTLKITRFES